MLAIRNTNGTTRITIMIPSDDCDWRESMVDNGMDTRQLVQVVPSDGRTPLRLSRVT
jgi:hypothetical protein